MHSLSRRGFILNATAAASYAAIAANARLADATPLGLPLGLQLYSLREQLPKNYEGTLDQIAALGYKEVEAAGFYGHSAPEVNAAMNHAGLHCVSAHYSWDNLQPKLHEIIEFGNKIGLRSIICAYPGRKDPSAKPAGRDTFSLEDWRWNAEQFNIVGETMKKAGIRFGYHNHTMEFIPQDGFVPMDELLRLTDADKVTLEMDCGWVVVGGANPVEYLKKYPTRFSMLHVKDFKALPKQGSSPIAAELGHGIIDYKPIFAAAKAAGIRHIFVEQEEFDMAPMDSLKVDAEYLRTFQG